MSLHPQVNLWIRFPCFPDEGKPVIPGAMVTLTGTGLSGSMQTGTSDADGLVTVHDLEPFDTLHDDMFELREDYGSFSPPNKENDEEIDSDPGIQHGEDCPIHP